MVLLLGLLAACGGGTETTATSAPRPTGAAADDPALLEGRRVYVRYCASCHGASGEGDPAPAFVKGRLLRRMPDAAEELALLRAGRAVMPSFGETLTALRDAGHLEDRDGAVWLRSRELGEDIDSVVVRSTRSAHETNASRRSE